MCDHHCVMCYHTNGLSKSCVRSISYANCHNSLLCSFYDVCFDHIGHLIPRMALSEIHRYYRLSRWICHNNLRLDFDPLSQNESIVWQWPSHSIRKRFHVSIFRFQCSIVAIGITVTNGTIRSIVKHFL